MSKMTQETEESRCAGCSEIFPREHLVSYGSNFVGLYCETCINDKMEEEANWARNTE